MANLVFDEETFGYHNGNNVLDELFFLKLISKYVQQTNDTQVENKHGIFARTHLFRIVALVDFYHCAVYGQVCVVAIGAIFALCVAHCSIFLCICLCFNIFIFCAQWSQELHTFAANTHGFV